MAMEKKYESMNDRQSVNGKIVPVEVDQWDKINEIVSEYMIQYGPDGHCDGSGNITKFITTLLGMSKSEQESLLSKTNFDEIEKIVDPPSYPLYPYPVKEDIKKD